MQTQIKMDDAVLTRCTVQYVIVPLLIEGKMFYIKGTIVYCLLLLDVLS